MKEQRVDAALASYETLIERARSSPVSAQRAAVLRSLDKRRVVACVGLGGHAAFNHLKSAWDDHHLRAEHHDVAESSTLALYRVAAVLGDPTLDPQAKNTYAIEHVAVGPDKARALAHATAEADGFRGGLVLCTDDETAAVLVYRFAHPSEFEVVRTFV